MKKYFQLDELGTNIRREFVAGLTTFLAMAYILFVNPNMLSETGMDADAVFAATAIAAAIGTLVMGLVAKYPVALAPGMGLNAFFTYTVVIGFGIPWETALAGVLASGLIFIILTLSGIREKVINAIPSSLKLAVGAGIGLFIAFIGLQNANIVQADPSTLLALGDITSPTVMLAIFGLVVSVILLAYGVKAGIFYGMIITAVAGMIFGLIQPPSGLSGVVSSVPSLAPTFGQAVLHFGEIFTLEMLVVILTFLFVDFFDTAGTLVAVASKAGIMKDNKLPRAGKALFSDASATVVGAVVGTSTTTAYVESTTGVSVGGRSGLTSVFTAGFFLLALFFSPLLGVVTSEVTAPALIIVGVLMVSALKDIPWDKFEIAVPAFFTVLMMPLTYSIATGIAIGFIFYPITMLVKGRGKEIHPIMYGLFVIFILYFIFLN
ncbi:MULTISPECIES: solute carrier family 23 protein [Oceanobacillus]|uniref:Guanine permease n=1 Tax=Oceanobacillus kimchii TaxID=746691 RepID=A0ABQ5TJ81_9BACI|nr:MULTISPECIES: solute carrier family 23 protein [Oceanobacillus]MBT2600583.1 NCS2 family permease [Oceanobacillus sp. ISL-74]MBT2651020.1 NCS2 family permease [Oceanobacillus sp. ISL-73]MCT1578923.1 NCS2 family permease [Oceanobacillus kimchii]MCT2137848.1 NCS2 family permease [Oceanobacillus kimchii]OEH53389.1 guanine permease [Oceanobacillus sp. E9]